MSVLELIAYPSHCLALHWFWSHVGRVGVGPQLGRAAVVCSCFLLWLTSLTLPREVVEFLTLFPSESRHPSLHRGFSLTVSSVMGLARPFLGAVHGGTVGCSSLTSCSVRGLEWFCLWAPDLVELFFPDLVEVWDVGACVVRLWSHVVAPVFRKLLCLGGCVPRCCFRIVFDSAGSAGVVFGPTLVVGRGITLFCCFIVLCSRWLTFQQGPCVSYRRVLLLLLGARAMSVVAVFARAVVGFILGLHIRVVMSRRLREPTCGVAFTGAGLWCSQSSSLLVLVEVRFPQNCVVLVFGCCGIALWVEVHRLAACVLVSVVWLVAVASPSKLRCIAWLPCYCATSGLRYAVVVLAGAFWWVSQNGALVVLVEVLPEPVYVAFAGCCSGLCSFWATVVLPLWFEGCRLVELRSGEVLLGRLLALLVEVVFLFIFKFLGCADGTSCVLMVGWFASLLAPCVLSQMGSGIVSVHVLLVPQLCLEALVAVWCVALSAYVVGAVPWFGAGVACSALFGLRLLAVLMLEWFVFVPSGALVCCIALWVAPDVPCGCTVTTVGWLLCLVYVALSVVHQVLAAACVRFVDVLSSWLCQPQTSSLVLPLRVRLWSVWFSFLRLHSRCVSLSDHEDNLGEIEWCRWTLSYVSWSSWEARIAVLGGVVAKQQPTTIAYSSTCGHFFIFSKLGFMVREFRVNTKSLMRKELAAVNRQPIAVDRPSLPEPQISGAVASCRQPAPSCRRIPSEPAKTLLCLLLSVDSPFLVVDSYSPDPNFSTLS
ncbi:hypothetical protein Taro_004674 [Colocasia esculenta]|uniref:Uncharacterized protein n=1 Tax=Colocasia esculenta TaxID=4460 RepID=A0A843TSB6_COLES|nr:hypothetical protein [Colocasia esculenta]